MSNAIRKTWMRRLRSLKRERGYSVAVAAFKESIKVVMPGTKTG